MCFYYVQLIQAGIFATSYKNHAFLKIEILIMLFSSQRKNGREFPIFHEIAVQKSYEK